MGGIHPQLPERQGATQIEPSTSGRTVRPRKAVFIKA
jgi:hypothetical protein